VIPTARVKIEILKFKDIPAVTLAAGHTRYALVTVQAGFGGMAKDSGRSKPIPAAGGEFSFTSEAVPWVFEFDMNPGSNIRIFGWVMEDHGDDVHPSPIPVSDDIKDPWTTGVYTIGSHLKAEVRVTTTLVNSVDAAFLARAAKGSGVSGVLTIPQGFVVEIIDIAGLYKPDLAAVPPVPGSKHVAGYLSEDNQGRIFTNRLPDGAWAKDTQFIEVKVRVTGLGGRLIPAASKIKWTMADADDPTNDSSNFHRDWGRYVDPNDYDGTGKAIGAHAADNRGAFSPGNTNELKLYGAAANGSATARWKQATGGPAVSPLSGTQAESVITGTGSTVGTSAVRLHCPNVLGTNFTLRAELTNIPAPIPVLNGMTGVMTMWSRIDVEVARMAGAHSVSAALPRIPEFFRPACVQLDLQSERTVTGALDKAEIAATEALEDAGSAAWVAAPGVFTHAGTPGWFFFGAARLPSPAPPGAGVGHAPAPIFHGAAYTLGVTGIESDPALSFSPFVQVTGDFPNADFVHFKWTAGGIDLSAGFGVFRTKKIGTKTRIFLFGNDVTNGFTGHDTDGAIDHAMKTQRLFYPRHQTNPGDTVTLHAGGYNIPVAGADVRIFAPGATFTSGISPSVDTGGHSYFAGRTIIFTLTDSFSEPNPHGPGHPPVPSATFKDDVLHTVVHEFTHAFGMPHKCGNFDWRTPRKTTCCMNYFNTWMLDKTNKAIPGSVDKMGNDMCGRHLMEIRRVHLERNKGLHW